MRMLKMPFTDNPNFWVLIAAIIGACISGFLSILAATGALLVGWLALRETRKDLTLSAYANAVRGILEIKQAFAQHPQIFETQMERDPSIKERIPDYMQD